MKKIQFVSSEDFTNAIWVIQNLIDQGGLLGYAQDDVITLIKAKAIIASELASMLHQEAGAEVTLEMEGYEEEDD